MRTSVFSTKAHDRHFLDASNAARHELAYLDAALDAHTAAAADGSAAVCLFVNDVADATVLGRLARGGVRMVALRCAGFNNVDLVAAQALGLVVGRVPEYSPHAIAEHTLALMLTLNRKIHRAYNRVREGNFALDGLLGFDFHGRRAGVVGTGRIGACVIEILRGFGCEVLAFDPVPDAACMAAGARYVALEELFGTCDIVTLHCPLTPQTRHLVDAAAIASMRRGVMLVNTSRGAVIDTQAVIDGLKSGAVGSLGLDVYEEEAHLFFRDLSASVLQDDVFARLLTFPNVVVTGHQAFFTEDAMRAIADSTIGNLSAFEATGMPTHPVSAERLV